MVKFAILLLMLCCFFAQSDKKQSKRGNKPPIVEKIEATPASLAFCEQPTSGGEIICATSRRTAVTLAASAKDPEGGLLSYKWSSDVGEILGEGNQVTWNLAEQKFGTHEAKVIVSDADGEETTTTIKVPIEECRECKIGQLPCPSVYVKSSYAVAHRAEKIIFYAEANPNWFFQSRPDYLWAIKGGKILKGQHSPQVEVEVTGEISTDVIATVQVEGFHPACNTSNLWSVPIKP